MSGATPTGVPILVEGFVVTATCDELVRRGWRVTPVPHTAAHGIDITAVKGALLLHVEAKGAGSSRAGSNRYGKSFTMNQVDTCVAKATYKALSVPPPVIGALALPDLTPFRKKANEHLRSRLQVLGIAIFWVAEDGSVTVEGESSLGPTSTPASKTAAGPPLENR